MSAAPGGRRRAGAGRRLAAGRSDDAPGRELDDADDDAARELDDADDDARERALDDADDDAARELDAADDDARERALDDADDDAARELDDAGERELDDDAAGRDFDDALAGVPEDMSFAPCRTGIRFTAAPRRKAPRWFVRALARRVARAARRLGIGAGAAVTCHLVDDPAIARLNAEHMGKVGPTDVLSFPAGPLAPGDDAVAGDVVISLDAVRRQARARLGLSDMSVGAGSKRQVLWGVVIETGPKEPVLPDMVEGSDEAAAAIDEATVLAVHGLCHLLGHDHGGRGEARAMHRAERRALRAAHTPDVPRPYGLDPRRERAARRTR